MEGTHLMLAPAGSLWIRLVLVIGAALLAASAPAADDEFVNAPSNCPYCHGDPTLMAAAGVLSHGGFEFGMVDTAGVDRILPELEILWAQSKHIEIGFALGPQKLAQSEKKKVRAELERLRAALPDVNPKVKVLDPWLRLHLYLQRSEDAYARFLEVLRVDDSVFPSGHRLWKRGTPYWGEGPYLGQKGRYELLMLPTAEQQVTFLRDQFGLQVRHTQKWNVVGRDSLMIVTNLTEDQLNSDQQLHNHVVFNFTHNFVDGFKHYSYDTPLWLKEGLAHVLERELDPKYNSFSFAEGGIAKKVTKSDWAPEVKKIIQRNKAPRLAELASRRAFSDYTPEDHLASWSMVKFLLEVHPEEFAKLNASLHGLKGPDGFPDGSKMGDRLRDAVRDCLGMRYAEFDVVWREWALTQ